MNKDLKRNLSSGSTWTRFAYLILFAVIFSIVEIVLAVVTVAQLLFTLGSGAPDPKLRAFGVSLGLYAQQVVRFQTFASDALPFPFTAWPESPAGEDEDGNSGAALPTV